MPLVEQILLFWAAQTQQILQPHVSSQRLICLSAHVTLLYSISFFLYRLWIRTICCRMRGPTTSLLHFSRQMCTPPPITPQHWANMTTAQTPHPLPAEPITTAETCLPIHSFIAMVTRLLTSLFPPRHSTPNVVLVPTFQLIPPPPPPNSLPWRLCLLIHALWCPMGEKSSDSNSTF